MNSPDIGIQIQDELNSLFTYSTNSQLESICEDVEKYLFERVRLTLLFEIQKIAGEQKANYQESSHRRFSYKEVGYELKIFEHASSSTILYISIKTVHRKQSQFIRKPFKIKFNSQGRYNEIQLSTDKVFVQYHEQLCETAKIILESGYRWLVEFMLEALSLIQDQTAHECYSLIRRLFNETISENIFLWKIKEGKGMYLTDDLTLRIALSRASKRDIVNGISPIEVVTNFSTTPTDFNKANSKPAIIEDRPVEGDFLTSKYAGSGHDLSEIIVYQSQHFVVQPLVQEGKTFLIAAYPTTLREQVEITLYKERGRFKQLIERELSHIEKTTTAVRTHGALPNISTMELPNTLLVRVARSIELKPNLGGLGLNLNNIIEEFLRYWYSERRATESDHHR
jgi:hypothetical protein